MPSQRSGTTSSKGAGSQPQAQAPNPVTGPAGLSGPHPALSGLGLDDEEEEEVAKPRVLRASAPRLVAVKEASGRARTIDASITSQTRGALDVSTRSSRPEKSEPTISVDDDMLLLDAEVEEEEVGPTQPPTGGRQAQRPTSSPVNAVRQVMSGPMHQVSFSNPGSNPRVSGSNPRGPGSKPESTLLMPSGPAPVVAGTRAHQVVVASRPSAVLQALSSSPDGGEATRIVDTLNLAELNQPRSRKTRAVVEALTPEALAQAAADKAEQELGESRKGPHKQKPVADVKASSKAKVTPIDPQRLAVQQEAAETKAREEKTGFQRLLGTGLGEDGGGGGAEHTMIGRFLGLVGIGDKSGLLPVPARDPAEEAWEAVQDAAFLDGLNPQYVTEAIRSGDLQVLRTGRDVLLETSGRALLVMEGQIALGRFKPDVLERERRAQRAHKPGDKRNEKREMKRRQEVGPIIRLAEINLALFSEGDLIGMESQDSGGQAAESLSVYTVTPAVVLSMSRARMEGWRRTYQFFGDRMRRAADAARSRIEANSGARSLVADFFVRQGLSVAMSLRVRELDKCIECYECEKACEQRYGVKRLSLNGKVLGALDFVDCCHTCVDQRCIDPCAFDAIKFDTVKKEVLIVEDACTGCTLCAVACPYDAIEMHELDDKPLLRLRLEREDKLGFGDSKPRKAKLRRMASKCDHCVSYEDQACISACPTGALLEIPPEAAFTERTESLADAAKGGFDHTVMVDAAQIFNPQKFMRGLEKSDDKGRVAERRVSTGWLWVLGGVALLVCAGEIALRRLWPTWSGSFLYQTRVEGLDALVAGQNVEYAAGESFSVWLGWIGTIIMFSSTFYSLRKWVPGMKRLGAQRGWFDYHVWAGTIGPAFVLLHSAAKLDNWVSLGIWAMVAVVISGLIGRYLTTELPDLASQASLQVLDLDRQMADLRNRHAGVSDADRYYERLRKGYARVTDPKLGAIGASWLAVRIMFWDELARVVRGPLLRSRLSGIKDRKVRRQVAALTRQLLLLERRRVLLPRVEVMFREWKTIHVPFAIVLTILAGIHITIELLRR